MPDKQWKLYKLHLLFYYYCGQIEMPFEDINTKTENMPAAGLLSDQAERGNFYNLVPKLKKIHAENCRSQNVALLVI